MDVGPIDILFNCAGYVHTGTILECEQADWQRSLDLNVTAMYRTIKCALPGMLERGGGSINSMSSAISSIRGSANRLGYGTSKAAVIGLTKSVAVDFIRRGIRCNAICPGMVATPSMLKRIECIAETQQRPVDEVRQSYLDRLPAGRMATVDEIAALVAYLASDEATYITGAVHVIDGGWSN